MDNWKDHVVQKWEQHFLYLDCMMLFVTCSDKKKVLSEQYEKSKSEFLSNWYETYLHESSVFDAVGYKVFVDALETNLCFEAGTRVTRANLAVFHARSLSFKICYINADGGLSLDPSFYYRAKWEDDIDGWKSLEEIHEDPCIRNWFHLFKERAKRYYEADMLRLIGGPSVDYDFSSVGKGPFTNGQITHRNHIVE